LPFELGWLHMRDDASFVNEGFYIYRGTAEGGLAARASSS
jgi:Uri superfamily endonuclease